ncbi:MAG: KH domain-containing protein [Candidatus Methanofastidiosia archaeon]
MNEEFVKVPKERIGIIIGKNGTTKQEIEKSLDIKLVIDSEECIVQIIDYPTTEDPLAVWKGKDIIRAIARGFSPHKAQKLQKDGNIVEIIDISEYVGKSKNSLQRIKGRIIGTEGKTRKIIETMTGVHLSVYGKTISLLGTFEDVYDAKKAVGMLLEGKPHSGVYTYLEKVSKEKKEREFTKRAL